MNFWKLQNLDKMKQEFYTIVIPLIINLFYEAYRFFIKLKKEKWYEILFRSIVVFFAFFLLSKFSFNLYENTEILKRYENSELYYNAKNEIDNKTNFAEKQIFNIGLKSIDELLDGVKSKDRIYIERKDIGEVWRILFNNAMSGSEVLATNCVVPTDWKFDKTNKLGIGTQRNAISRGISIKRLLIRDDSNEIQGTGQKEIYTTLKSELDSNYYKSNIISLSQLTSNTFNSSEIIKYIDIGLVKLNGNKEILFITDLTSDYTIKGAWITTNQNEIAKVKKIYTELWKELK